MGNHLLSFKNLMLRWKRIHFGIAARCSKEINPNFKFEWPTLTFVSASHHYVSRRDLYITIYTSYVVDDPHFEPSITEADEV